MGDTIWDWDKTAANNATADSAIDWSEGQMPSTVNNSAREMMAKIAYLLEDISSSLVTGGTGDAYTISPGKPPSDLTKGWIGVVRFDRANTGASTFQVGSLTAADLVDAEGNALTGGEIVANGIYIVSYNPTSAKFHLVNRVPLHAGEVGADEIAAGAVTPAKIDSSNDFTFRYVYADALIAYNNPSNDNVGGRIRVEPPVNAVNTDTSSAWNCGFQLDTDGVGEDFFKFTWKANSGVWRSYKLPLNTGGYVWADDNFAARISALTANTSPTGTESVACDDGKKVTLQAIAAFAFSNPDFTSGALTIDTSSTGVLSAAHGLGVRPSFVMAKLVCKTAELGYSVGDEIPLIYTNVYTSVAKGFNLTADAANIYFIDGLDGFYIGDKSTASFAGITAANWDLYLMAWR